MVIRHAPVAAWAYVPGALMLCQMVRQLCWPCFASGTTPRGLRGADSQLDRQLKQQEGALRSDPSLTGLRMRAGFSAAPLGRGPAAAAPGPGGGLLLAAAVLAAGPGALAAAARRAGARRAPSWRQPKLEPLRASDATGGSATSAAAAEAAQAAAGAAAASPPAAKAGARRGRAEAVPRANGSEKIAVARSSSLADASIAALSDVERLGAGVAAEVAAPIIDVIDEERVAKLEGRMHELAKAEDYRAAAAVRDELGVLTAAQLDDEANVLRANTELYEAFSARDFERMKALWLQAPYVQCIHPDEKRSLGHRDVCASWRRRFEAPAARQHLVTAEDMHVNVRGATATVVCTEHVVLKARKKPVRSMLATNIFRKVGVRWLLVHRHVSSCSPTGDGAFGFGGAAGEDEDPISNAAWKLSQLARAASSIPGTRIIIQQADPRQQNFRDGDEDEEHGVPEAIRAELNGMHDEGSLEDEGSDGPEDDDEDSEEEDFADEDEEDEMEAARATVRALRQLSHEGRITQQAKILLLLDIVRSPGDSMLERAYSLLLTNIPEEDEKAAWEDFAEIVAVEAKKKLDASGNAWRKARRTDRK